MRATTLCTLIALCAVGCTSETQPFDPAAPTLTLVTSGPCDGENIVPLATEDQITGTDLPPAARLTVTGIDAGNASGDLTPGTRVTFEVVDPESEEDQLRAGFGGFVSTRGQEIPGERVASEPIEFVGRTATESFYCVGPGTVLIRATVEAYEPAAGGDTRTLETRTLPVRCMEQMVYRRTCETGMAPDGGGPVGDGGVDPTDGGPSDAGGDMGDGAINAPPGEFTINFVPPADPSELEIGIRGSGLGRPDSVLLQFRVSRLDQPVVGRTVTFELPANRPPNVRLIPDEAVTDAQGIAQVRVLAGGSPGVLTVKASTTDDDPETDEDEEPTDRSGVVVIRGGVPSAAQMQFECDDLIIPAFITRLGADDWRLGQAEDDGTECTVQLADRAGGHADAGTRVFFLTEAGSVTQQALGDETGLARTRHRVGPPVPYDTDPLPYEEANGFDGVFNPRDGLVRLVAVTRGEEAFTDFNGNKIFDDAIDVVLPGQDLGEPYIDINDNGRYDNDENAGIVEVFRDTNGNGSWDGPNDLWDDDAEIWTSTLVLWVGNLHRDPLDPDIRSIFSYCLGDFRCSREPFDGNCPRSDFYLDFGGTVFLETRFADRNGNCPDGYESGSSTINIDGALVADNDGFDFINRCFARVDEAGDPITIPHPLSGEPSYVVGDGKVEYPLTTRHTYALTDASGDAEGPVVSRVEVTVEYTEAGGDVNLETFGFTICR